MASDVFTTATCFTIRTKKIIIFATIFYYLHRFSSVLMIIHSKYFEIVCFHSPFHFYSKMDPPPPQTFETRDELKQYLLSFAMEHGYAISTLRPDSQRHTITLKCDLGGSSRPSPKNRRLLRAGGRRLIGCPFQIFAKKSTDGWTFNLH